MLLADCSEDGILASGQIRKELDVEKLCKDAVSEYPMPPMDWLYDHHPVTYQYLCRHLTRVDHYPGTIDVSTDLVQQESLRAT